MTAVFHRRGRGRPDGAVNAKATDDLGWLVALWLDSASRTGHRNLRSRVAQDEFGKSWADFTEAIAAGVHARLVVNGEVKGIGKTTAAVEKKLRRVRDAVMALWRKDKN